VRNANPLRMDPTRTVMIRKRFMAEILKTMRNLKRHLVEFMVTDDALALKDRKSIVPFSGLTGLAQPRRFEFHTSADKLKAFNEWFQQQVEADVLSPDVGTPVATPWTTEFVESSYRRGMLNAYASSKQAKFLDEAGVGDMTQEEFLRSSFGAPEARSKVQLLATRSLEQLKGATNAMGSEMNRILAQGMADGSGPEAIAREMTARIDSLTRSRAMTIARTEIINAHAEGQLDSFEKLGVKELGIKAEWSTAGDDRVCPECAPNEGRVFDMETARGMIPLHPNCRCSWIPSAPGAKAQGSRPL